MRFLDVYADSAVEAATTTEKMLMLNKKSFDMLTQGNMRRSLISSNHSNQMKVCRDLHHIVNIGGGNVLFFKLNKIV